MDANKFDACKEKCRQSVVGEIDKLLTGEWDRLITSITAVCDMDETFPLTITVNMTPHEGGIVHVAGLKYKCTREAEGTPGFVRYDGSEQVQGDLFEGVEPDDLEEQIKELVANEGELGEFDDFMDDARKIIIDQNSATSGVLMFEMAISETLAKKTLKLLELQGFLGPIESDGDREIISLREPTEDGQPPVQQTTGDDPFTQAMTANGYNDAEMFIAAAAKIVRETKRATYTMIQRRMKVSFAVAQIIMEKLENGGVVTSPDPEGKREVIEPANDEQQAPEGSTDE